MTTHTSPVPTNLDESGVAVSPLGLEVVVQPSLFPDVATYTIPAGAGYNTTTLPMTVMSGRGRLFFVQNNQVTAIRVVGTATNDAGFGVAAGALAFLMTNAAGNVLSPTDTAGGGGTDPGAPFQAAWFIDATNGLDTNPGTAAAPLKTHKELETRMGDQLFQQSTDITIVGGLPSTDPINIFYGAAGDFDIRYLQGAADTVDVAGGIVAAPTAINRATNTPQSFNSNVSLDAVIGKKLVRTGGAGTWNVAWLGKIVAAGVTYRNSPAVALPTIPTLSPAITTMVAGDTFEVRTSPTISLGIICTASLGTITFNRFQIDFGAFTSVVGANFLNFQECGQVSGGAGQFLNQPGVISYIACKTLGMTLSNAINITLRSGLALSSNINGLSGASQITMAGDQLMQAAPVSVSDGSTAIVNAAGFFDAGSVSITAVRAGAIRVVTGFYGSGVPTQVNVNSGGYGWYAVLPTAVGATQDLLIGGLARAFNATPRQIPWADTGEFGSQSYFVATGTAVNPVTGIKIAGYNAAHGETVQVDPTGVGFIVTLPVGNGSWPGSTVTVKKTTASANVVTVAAGAGNTVEGAASVTISNNPLSSATYKFDGGTNWNLIAQVT